MKPQALEALEKNRTARRSLPQTPDVTKELRQVSNALVACGVCVARLKLGR